MRSDDEKESSKPITSTSVRTHTNSKMLSCHGYNDRFLTSQALNHGTALYIDLFIRV